MTDSAGSTTVTCTSWRTASQAPPPCFCSVLPPRWPVGTRWSHRSRARTVSSVSTCWAAGDRQPPLSGYDIPAQARRVGAVLDKLGVSRVTVIGHSSGCTVATALAEQRPDAVAALALIDIGPSLDAKIPESLLFRLLLTPFPGRLLWRLRTKAAIRKAARTGFTRPVDIPDAFIEDAAGDDAPGLRGGDARAPELPRAAEPSRPANPAGPAAAGDLRRRRPAVALLVGCRLSRRARRPRRVAAGRGTHPDDGRPASDRQIAAGTCRSRRYPN